VLKNLFEEEFQIHIMIEGRFLKVYKEIGKDIPAQLFVPILRHDRGVSPTLTIRGFIKPTIDGLVTSYYEWYQGAQLDVKKSGGSMHKSESLISTIYFGFDKDNLFLIVSARQLCPGIRIVSVAGDPAVRAKLSKAGDHAFKAELRFSVCTKKHCELKREQLSWVAKAQ